MPHIRSRSRVVRARALLCRVFNKVESADCMRRRVSEFGRWLTHRPEKVVVAFGHSTFWKYFSNSKTRMRNCEVVQLWW